jgi:hypothetical protein
MTIASNLFSNEGDPVTPTLRTTLQNRGFYKPSRAWMIDESLFKDFGCADRLTGWRGL